MADILVTGGAGFIGSHTVELLLRKGYSVVVLDNFRTGEISNINHLVGKIKIVQGDVRDEKLLSEIVKNIDGIIHLAAVVSVDEAIERPKEAFEINGIGTLNLLELARKYDIENFVYASSAAVYGDPIEIPISENHPLNPKNPYGASKLSAEMLVNSYRETYGLKTISLRYFNVYGPRMKPGPYAGAVIKFVSAALKNKKITIFGDGNQIRDLIYVSDVARANIIALEKNETGVFNVGTGKGTKIIDVARRIIELTKSKSEITYTPPRPGDIRESVANIEKITTKLKWEPTVTLEMGLKLTINFEKAKNK